MKKLTIEQFCNQWLLGSEPRYLVSRFEKNILDFTIIVGNRSKMFFQSSFDKGGFAGGGGKWQPRQSRWGKRFDHKVLYDSGQLKKTVDGSGKEINRGKFNKRGPAPSRGAKFEIHVDAESNRSYTPGKKKRGRSKGKGYYAAIHNSDPNKTSYTVNQYSTKKPIRRQFIGLSKKLDNDVNRFIPIIFRTFPFP